MNDILFDFPQLLLQAYINNIFICNKTLQYQRSYVCQILKHSQKVKLQGNVNNCKFHIKKIKFFGFDIFSKYIKIDSLNVSFKHDWAELTFLEY